MSDSYLVHWRTKGSKNGQRLYQNEDGTWTTIGKERRRDQYNSERNNSGFFRKAAAVGLIGATALAAGAAAASSAKASDKNKVDMSSMSDEELRKASTRSALENKYKENMKKQEMQPGKQFQDISRSVSDATNSAGKIIDAFDTNETKRQDLTKYTNEDLQKMIDRLSLERRYSELSAKDTNRGKDYLKKTLEIVGGLATIGGSVAAIAVAIHNLKKNN